MAGTPDGLKTGNRPAVANIGRGHAIADDEIVLVSGCSPIHAKKARYFEDERFRERVIPPATLGSAATLHHTRVDDWSGSKLPAADVDQSKQMVQPQNGDPIHYQANSGIRREPELPQHEDIAPERAPAKAEFDFADEETDDEVQRASTLMKQGVNIARQAAMDPGDGLGL